MGHSELRDQTEVLSLSGLGATSLSQSQCNHEEKEQGAFVLWDRFSRHAHDETSLAMKPNTLCAGDSYLFFRFRNPGPGGLDQNGSLALFVFDMNFEGDLAFFRQKL